MRQTDLSTLTSLRILIPLILILAAVAVFLNRSKIHATHEGSNQGSHLPTTALTAVLLGIYLIVYLYLTFGFRRPAKTSSIDLTPFWSYREAFQWNPLKIRRLALARQILLNILLTVPAGLLLPILYQTKHPYLPAILTILALSVLTETLQYFTHLGLCETDDVIDNLLGGLLGMAILRIGSITKTSKTEEPSPLPDKQTDKQEE